MAAEESWSLPLSWAPNSEADCDWTTKIHSAEMIINQQIQNETKSQLMTSTEQTQVWQLLEQRKEHYPVHYTEPAIWRFQLNTRQQSVTRNKIK